MRDQGWFLSIGFGGTCGLCSKGESLVRGETRRHGGGEGRRDGSGGYREHDHLGFLHGGDGQQEGRRLTEQE